MTEFSFQITDHSRVCSDYYDPASSQRLHRSCAVHGGDGFAFVLHSDEIAETNAIGRDGQDLGYGGIRNSMAIEFDMWTNVDTQGSDDLFEDHISIQSLSTAPNSAGATSALGYSRGVDMADGKIHRARIEYLPYLERKYIDFMTANDNLLPYIKDNGEGRRLGTLSVFIDDGLDKNTPILSIPLNLSVLLSLPESLAYVGFTASTGANWEKHDILHWHWCDSSECQGDVMEMNRFDIEESSAIR